MNALKRFMDKSEIINKLIEENRFVKRKKQDPNGCPCYTDKKCHSNLSDYDLICFFCLCPEYENNINKGGKGGCNLNDPINLWNIKGKWFNSPTLGTIWDCSDCVVPHTEKYVRYYLENLSLEELDKIQICKSLSDFWEFFKNVS